MRIQSYDNMTASLQPVIKNLDKTFQFLNPLYLIGTVILFLLFLTLSVYVSKPFLGAFICHVLFRIIAVIYFYEFIYHGSVLTHQDIGNVSMVLNHLSDYKVKLNRTVKFIKITFLVVQIVVIHQHIRKINFANTGVHGFIPQLC